VPFCRGAPLVTKAQKPKVYSEKPQSLVQHLKKRRREFGLLQREVAKQLGVVVETLSGIRHLLDQPLHGQTLFTLALC
jgi:hypothetical protein